MEFRAYPFQSRNTHHDLPDPFFLSRINSTSAAVQTYAQDHRNDVATNTVGLASAMLGDRLFFWIDPLGAILLAMYIIYNWSETAMENIKAMVGVSAPPEFLTQLTYLDLSDCENITDTGLEHIAQLTQLTSLDVWGCSKITELTRSQIDLRTWYN